MIWERKKCQMKEKSQESINGSHLPLDHKEDRRTDGKVMWEWIYRKCRLTIGKVVYWTETYGGQLLSGPKLTKSCSVIKEEEGVIVPLGLRHRSATARLLRLWVRISPGTSMFVVLCIVRYRSLRRAYHSSRGVLLTVVRRCVWSRNLVNDEALAHWGVGAVAPKTTQ
jgi:hypothetical protein